MNISRCRGYVVNFSRKLTEYNFNSNEFCNVRKSFAARNFSAEKPKFQLSEENKVRLKSTRNYAAALGIITLAAAYAAVPLYRIFCQASGYGGTVKHDISGNKIEKIEKKPYRKISVKFMSDVSTNLQWNFKPQQREIVVIPGETALAFYTATNPLDKPVIGISTYNVLPYEAAPYFNKIQCFCFEEQQLNPKEQVDMPVFFYIDPEFCEDPKMENIDEIILSYTFFQAKEGMSFSNLLKGSQLPQQ